MTERPSRFTNFHTTGDVLRLAYNEEHAGAYCSPGWTRNGSRVVALAIVEHYRGDIDNVDALLKWLRETTMWPGRLLRGAVVPNDDLDQTDQHYWDRARTAIADYVERDRNEKKKVTVTDEQAR